MRCALIRASRCTTSHSRLNWVLWLCFLLSLSVYVPMYVCLSHFHLHLFTLSLSSVPVSFRHTVSSSRWPRWPGKVCMQYIGLSIMSVFLSLVVCLPFFGCLFFCISISLIVCLSVCLTSCVSNSQSTSICLACLSIFVILSLSVFLTVSLACLCSSFLCLSVFLPVYQSNRLTACLIVSPSVCVPVCVPVYLSVYLFVCLHVCLSVCLFVCLS